jgi:DNA-binding response OmpR family regulator/Tfp pilus assembly protein PilF
MSNIDPLRDRKFLLVEDFEAMRSVLKGLLLRCGAQRVDTANDGREAVSLLRNTSYDIVMCDYNLGPGKNGQQLLEESRMNGWIGPAAVWLMVTAEKTSDMVSVAAEEAPDDYLLKPITESLLQGRLFKLVERKTSLASIAAAMKASDWRLALQLCNEQLAAGTRNAAEVLRLQSQLYQKVGDWTKAKALYEAVLQRGPIAWAKLGLAQVHLHQDNLLSARSLLVETVRDHPQYLEAYDCLASMLAAQGQHQQEFSVLERAATISPNSAARQSALGAAAMKLGQADTAARAFTRSMKLAEHSAVENVEPFLGLARIHSESGAPNEAQKVLANLTKRHDSPKAQVLAKAESVRALHAAGDVAGAVKLAGELAAMARNEANPLPSGLAMRIAETLIESQQVEGGTSLLQYVTRNNHDDEALLKRAQQAFDKAGIGAAGKEVLAAARRQATDSMTEGVRLMATGDLPAALANMRAAKVSMPQNTRVLLNFAAVALTCVERQGRSAELESEVRLAIAAAHALRPDDPRGAELLGRLAMVAASTP